MATADTMPSTVMVMPKRLRVTTAVMAPIPARTSAQASASRKYWAHPSTFVYPIDDE